MMPNSVSPRVPKAVSKRTLESVRFRVKAPVTRRPPHRAGREGFPHPVPREPEAAANGEPRRRHPAWRITWLSLALREVGHDPGLRSRPLAMDGIHPLLPAAVAFVAAAAQPVAPSPLGVREAPCAPLAIATAPLVLGRATYGPTPRPIRLLP